jgi:regulator of sigma E protease
MRMIWSSLIDTISGKYGTEALSGPVGVVGEMKETAEKGGASALVYLFMVLTLNLGIINLLPIPALDGGRLFFLLIEFIRKKPLNPKFEGALNFAFLMLLMLLMVFITVKDIAKIF